MPVLAGQLLDMLVGFTDTWLTGNYLVGSEYLAAMNLVAYLLWFMSGLFALVSIGATALVARFVGANDWPLAQRAANQAVFLGMVLCLAPLALVIWLGEPLVRLLGLNGDAATLVLRYLWLVLPAVPAMMLEQVGVACLRGAGDTVTGVVAMIVVNLIDMVASYCLVRGVGPFPELGWDGLALGTTLGYLGGTGLILFRLFRGRGGLKIERRLLRPEGEMIRRLLRISLPGGLDLLALIACQLWFVQIVNQLGDLPAAAHGVAIKIESLSYLPAAAFQVAATTMVGQYLGAGDPRRAKRSAIFACAAAATLMSAAGVLLYWNADWLGAQFVSATQREIGVQAAALVRIVTFAQPALAILLVLTGALRGAGDTRWTLVITFVGLVGVRIPLAYVLSLAAWELPWGGEVDLVGLGVRGAWFAMATDLGVRCVLIVARFAHGGWKRIEV